MTKKIMRKIISIDEDKCDGCGLCIPACEEGALQVVDGKARLVKDVYCDGLGACLGECPREAINIIEREAMPFDEKAVEEHLHNMKNKRDRLTEGAGIGESCAACGAGRILTGKDESQGVNAEAGIPEAELSHWPVQLHLVSPESRFLQDQDLLIAADCVPFAFADFHRRFLSGRSLVIGCPKLDDVEAYHGKLVEIFKRNNLKSINLVHMEVGCCFGLSRLVRSALQEAGVDVPLEETIVGVDGSIKS